MDEIWEKMCNEGKQIQKFGLIKKIWPKILMIKNHRNFPSASKKSEEGIHSQSILTSFTYEGNEQV